MTLTTEERLLVVTALRQRAETFAGLGARPYGKKAYREERRQRGLQYARLADAFAAHTEITLTKKD